MPNGGSDCCGTCWFNSTNDGQPGFRENPAREGVRCTIRDVAIENPFWTYCANHPHHNPARLTVPVGPVYSATDRRNPYERKRWIASPDTEEIRNELLRLLAEIEEVPCDEYPTATRFDEEVIRQLMVFDEKRALPGIRRVLSFDPFSRADPSKPFSVNRTTTVGVALEATAKMGDESLVLGLIELILKGFASIELPEELRKLVPPKDYEPLDDLMVPLRYSAVRALRYCRSEEATALVEVATHDPAAVVAGAAREELRRRTDV